MLKIPTNQRRRYSCGKIFTTIESFLRQPTPDLPLNEPIGQILKEKKEDIRNTVLQEFTENSPKHLDSVSELSFIEKARDIGSWVTHEALDTVADWVEPFPRLISQIKDIGLKILPEGPEISDSSRIFPNSDPLELHKERVSSLHDKIDRAFNTEYAYQYTEEYKSAAPPSIFDVGLLPPPGFLNGIFTDSNALSAAGRAFDRGGLTKAGRGLMKHGYRTGSAFPKPVGLQSK